MVVNKAFCSLILASKSWSHSAEKEKRIPFLSYTIFLVRGGREGTENQSLSSTALSQFHAMETLSIIGNKLSILEANICYMRENAKAQ